MSAKNHTWNSHYHQRFKTTEQKFWEKVSVGQPDECWEWQAGKYSTGYGGFLFRKKHTKAHRVAWILTNGEIPDGMLICHKCDNIICCNPNHLFVGTAADNNSDRDDKGRGKFPFLLNNELAREAGLKGNYSPKRQLRMITHDGLSLSVDEWEKRTGINKSTIKTRIDKLGWTTEKALTTKARKLKYHA